MLLLKLFEPVVHRVIFIIRYLGFVLGIVEFCKVIELFYQLKILVMLLVNVFDAREKIHLFHVISSCP